MIPCIWQPDIITNTAHGDVPARIQVDIVVDAGQVPIGCRVLPGWLVFDEGDAVETEPDRFALLQPWLLHATVVLPILTYDLVEAIEGLLVLVKGFPEFFVKELGEPVVIVAIVDAACELCQVGRLCG